MAQITFTAEDFKASDEADAKTKFLEEIKYDLYNALAKYGQDKFGQDASLKQQKIVYEKWVSSLNDEKIIQSLKAGGIDTYIDSNYLDSDSNPLNWVAEYVSGVQAITSAGIEPSLEILIDALGFVEYFNQYSGYFTSDDNIASVNDLENLSTNQLSTLKNATAKALGIETKTPSIEEQRALRQCALFSDLLHKGYSYRVYPKSWRKGEDEFNKAFNGRIYPVDPGWINTSFDPNMLMNKFIIPKNVRTYLSSESETINNFLSWDLSWIYRDATGLSEAKIWKNSTNIQIDQEGNDDPVYKDLKNKGLITKEIEKSITIKATNHGYSITNVTINFDGTNPATARNDVKVDITIQLDHISSLNTPCAMAKYISNLGANLGVYQQYGLPAAQTLGGLAMVKIRDLITISQDKTIDIVNPYRKSDGTMAYQATSYVPEASRIRLKVWYNEGTNNTNPLQTSVALITDLSMIDHKIERSAGTSDDATNPCTLTISYRGYFEEVMNAPYNDALTDITMIQNRIRRTNLIKNQAKSGCSDKLIRQLQKVQEEEHRIESEAFHKNGGLIKRLNDEGLLYSYSIDDALYSQGLYGSNLDISLGNYISADTIQPKAAGTLSDSLFSEASKQINEENTYFGVNLSSNLSNFADATRVANLLAGNVDISEVVEFSKSTFFFLGDLMEILLDCLYQDNTATHHTHTQDLNLRFIVGCIEVPDPKDATQTLVINPLQIPIDLAFFASWYHDTIVKKGIQSYAVGPFIKDLIERLVNDVLYDNCFSLLQIDEAPPQLRSTFLSDNSDKWFKTSTYSWKDTSEQTIEEYWLDPDMPFGLDAEDDGRLAIMKRDISAKPGSSHNYCIIYQQFPSFFRQKIGGNSDSQFKNSEYVPSLFDGYKSTTINYCANVSFSKVESNSYLREARYFNNSFGRLALLSNVYNLTFEIKNKRMNTFFYPGNIINFIISDFASAIITESSDAWTEQVLQDGSRKPKLGRADPHTNGTDPNILGLGGYFIVTKVSYTLTPTQAVSDHSIKVETRFIGTDSRIPIVGGTENANPFANEPKNCEIAFNNAVNSLRVSENTLKVDAIDFTYIRTESNIGSGIPALPKIGQGFQEPPVRVAEGIDIPTGVISIAVVAQNTTGAPETLEAFAKSRLKTLEKDESGQVVNPTDKAKYILKFKNMDNNDEIWTLTKKDDTNTVYNIRYTRN